MLTHRVPYPPDRGDRIRSWNILRHLSQTFDVSLGCVSEEPICPDARQRLESVCCRVAIAPIGPQTKWLSAGISAARGRSLTEGLFWSRSLGKTLDRWAAAESFDAVLVYCSGMLRYARRRDLNNVPRFVDLVDVDSQKFYDYADNATTWKRAIYRTEGHRVRRMEHDAVRMSKAVTLVSDAEATVLSETLEKGEYPIHGIANGVDTEYFCPTAGSRRTESRQSSVVSRQQEEESSHSSVVSRQQEETREPQTATVSARTAVPAANCQLATDDSGAAGSANSGAAGLVFVGVMDYLPNIEGVQWFADRVWPLLREQFPTISLEIVGKHPTPAVLKLSRIAGIQVTGAVPDVRPHVAGADIVIAPLQIARGIQNKVLEAMAMARPVVATTSAATGIDAINGQHLMIADSPQQWVDQITPALFGSRASRSPVDPSPRIGLPEVHLASKASKAR